MSIHAQTKKLKDVDGRLSHNNYYNSSSCGNALKLALIIIIFLWSRRAVQPKREIHSLCREDLISYCM